MLCSCTCKYNIYFIYPMLSQFQAYPFSLGIFLAFCSYSGHFSLTKVSLGQEIFHCLINLTLLLKDLISIHMLCSCTCKYNIYFIYPMLSQFQAYPFSLGIFLAFCSYSGHFSLTKVSLGQEIFHCLINLTPLRGTI